MQPDQKILSIEGGTVMRGVRKIAGLMLCLLLGAGSAGAASVETYAGLCDASAGFALGANHFVVVDNEHNVLTLYKTGQARPVRVFPLHAFLGTDEDDDSDLEAAAVVGDRVYIVSSHGRTSGGKEKGRRHRFFAVDIDPARLSVSPVGKPYKKLQRDLLATPAQDDLRLKAAAKLPPEQRDGFNIEGLAAADGGLLIGFRNPLVGGKAILVPLDNPAAVIKGKTARFGAPILIDLGGRGIRGIERVGKEYVIAAGPVADDGTFALYRWSGASTDAPVAFGTDAIAGMKPEGLFELPGTTAVRILSDDGDVRYGERVCKDVPAARKQFRNVVVTP
ncbi:DUF3616 domain-containing protein [Cupriavidus necator]